VLDLVIKGGTVVAGSGAAPVQANVGVRDGRIVFVDAGGGLYSQPEGIQSVTVEGVTTVEDGRLTGATPGRVLRRGSS
jgi:N-acyl-D-aspartate/D-glutamate deacylase